MDKISGSDKKHRSASCKAVQDAFEVKQTGRKKDHHIVILPEPLTQKTVDLFNSIFLRPDK